LAISQTIIQTHGGRIVAENNPDGGASFRVVLPMSHHGPAADKEEAVPAVEVV